MEQIARQCRFITTLAAPAVADLGDAHRALEPSPGTKTAGWLVGHLAVTGDFARRLPARDALPTTGDFAAYLMTGHFGHHLGQLFTWRAAAGLPRVS